VFRKPGNVFSTCGERGNLDTQEIKSVKEVLPERTGLKPNDWLNQGFSFPESGFNLEKEILRLIQLAIEQTGGNISEAARMLGVPRDYIRYRLKKMPQPTIG